jgi:hypothetical protein
LIFEHSIKIFCRAAKKLGVAIQSFGVSRCVRVLQGDAPDRLFSGGLGRK